MAQKTQNQPKVAKLSSSKKKVKRITMTSKIVSFVRTVSLTILLTIIILAQGIIITQNDLIGKQVQLILFLVEGGKRSVPKPRYPSDPTSFGNIRHYKVNHSFNDICHFTNESF